MNAFAALVAPMLLWPVAGLPEGESAAIDGGMARLAEQSVPAGAVSGSVPNFPFTWVMESFRSPSANQVSIEQQIIIRITPRTNADPRVNMLADLPNRSTPPRLEERKMAKCVPVAGVAGVQISATDKLMLFMRDRTIVSAGLDKGCTARDFYSGFYVQRSKDGMMCTGRDKLQSRNGASCKLGKLHQLVEAGN